MSAPAAEPRSAEIAANLAAVRDRIARACAAADRDPGGITLIAVTKTFPAADARRLVDLGVPDLGENRDQEARAKAAELAALPNVRPRWHFVGRLQRNKCRSVAGYAAAVHSVDRPELVDALDRGAGRADRHLDVLVQVNLDDDLDSDLDDDDAGRGGIPPGGVPALAAAVAASDRLRLAGVMAVAPLGGDPDPAFARLAAVAAALRADHPAATAISAGMSGDLEAAIRNGATHVRVGTALLGGRTPVSR